MFKNDFVTNFQTRIEQNISILDLKIHFFLPGWVSFVEMKCRKSKDEINNRIWWVGNVTCWWAEKRSSGLELRAPGRGYHAQQGQSEK